MYLIQNISKLLKILTKRQKFNFLIILAFFFISSLIQLVGVASIAPLVTILSNPDAIQNNRLLNFTYKLFQSKSNYIFSIQFATFSLVMILVSNCASVSTAWIQLKFSTSVGKELQKRLYSNYINRDYIFHKTSNHTKAISVISNQAPRFIYMVLQPTLYLFLNLFIAALILAGLIIYSASMAFISGALISGAYLATFYLLKSRVKKHGRVITERLDKTQKILSESFNGIKDIKLNSLEHRFIDRFNTINAKGLNSSAFLTLSEDIPKFVIESIAFSAMLVLAISMLLKHEPPQNVVEVLSIYAIAGYRLLPTMQQIYKSISMINSHSDATSQIEHELSQKITHKDPPSQNPLPIIYSIKTDSLSFKYPKSEQLSISSISSIFKLGELNTIAGHSGSGKSTFVDLILGLLVPQEGKLLINEQVLKPSDLSSYQLSVSYLPQQIFILDDSVIANVAFGVDSSLVDTDRVKQALKQANAFEFVENLPHGLHTQLGQDGKLLSGGQRQRIGIARAFYKNSKVLILDEPTSALDINSEHDFMTLLSQLKHKILIIVISHRPAAIKLSDIIFLFEKGQLVASGSYQTLVASNREFQIMMEKSSIQIERGQG